MSATATIQGEHALKSEDFLIAHDPATGEAIGRVAATAAAEVPAIVARARRAQMEWGAASWKARRAVLESWRAELAREAGAWADLVRLEIGKPRVEALAGDVVPTLDAIRWTIRHAGRTLAARPLGAGWQRWLMLPSGRVEQAPLGVIGMLGTWNYPLFLNAPPIAQALAAGNAVVWKASESAPLCGAKLEEGLKAAGVPEGLVGVLQGGPAVGRALIESGIDKGMFTGGVENGRRVLEALGRRGVPGLAELSGFDAAVVLPDAPLSSTIAALAWGAYVGCGQTCVAVKRVYVIGDPAPWAEALAASARALRMGPPNAPETDVGPLISAVARERFHATVRAAVASGARVLAGGAPADGPGHFYPPTVLLADSEGPEDALAGAFGPVVVVRGVPDASAAIAAANRGPFALAASVWGRDRAQTRALARQVRAGTVAINDAVAPTAHAAAPFGGAGASGFGRTKGPAGLLEFAQPRAVFERPAGGFRPHLFPYGASRFLERFLAAYQWRFHRAPRRGR